MDRKTPKTIKFLNKSSSWRKSLSEKVSVPLPLVERIFPLLVRETFSQHWFSNWVCCFDESPSVAICPNLSPICVRKTNFESPPNLLKQWLVLYQYQLQNDKSFIFITKYTTKVIVKMYYILQSCHQQSRRVLSFDGNMRVNILRVYMLGSILDLLCMCIFPVILFVPRRNYDLYCFFLF